MGPADAAKSDGEVRGKRMNLTNPTILLPDELPAALARVLQNRVCYRPLPGDRRPGDDASCEMREATFTFKTPDSARDLAAFLASTCPEPRRAVIGLTELLINAVEHGNLGIGYEEKGRLREDDCWEQAITARLAQRVNADKAVWVEYAREPGRIRIVIRDQGDGFDWRSHLEMDPAQASGLHGRGIALARMISFDSIEFRGKGNEVEVTVNIPTNG